MSVCVTVVDEFGLRPRKTSNWNSGLDSVFLELLRKT